MADISLTEAQRRNIATLRDIQDLSDRTQERLSTGKAVNNVVDDAVAYFASQNLENRADEFIGRKEDIDQGISTLEASLNAIESIGELLDQMKAVAEASGSQSPDERLAATEQFQQIGTQISQLVEDASYQGYNLLSETNNELNIRFSDRTAARIIIGGFDFNSTSSEARQLFTQAAFDTIANGNEFFGLEVLLTAITVDYAGAAGAAVNGFSQIGDNNSNLIIVDETVAQIEGAADRLRAASVELGGNVSLLQTRSNFSQSYVDTLNTGADKLTLADINEEGANLTALQTRQQLGTEALAISGDQQEAVLTLLR